MTWQNLGWAFWLGILTAISPCPLATNVLAVSFIGRRFAEVRQVFLSGLLYTLGRTLAYVALAIALVGGLMSIPGASNFLQRYIELFMGPLLILVGMVMLELVSLPLNKGVSAEKATRLVERGGLLGAAFLGLLFALAFCPVSAAYYFGALIPLCLKGESRFLLPALYGVGTALPVLGFAVLVGLGVRSTGSVFNRIAQFEWWARRITGALFLLAGLYFSVKNVWGLL